MEINADCEDKLYDILDAVAFDIVSKRQYNYVLKNLFSKDSGEWYSITDLYLEHERLSELFTVLNICEISIDDIVATWLRRPNVNFDDPYSIVFFYCDPLQWNNIAIYNKSTL